MSIFRTGSSLAINNTC